MKPLVIKKNMVFFSKSPTTQQCTTMKTQPAKAGGAFRHIGADMRKLCMLTDLVRPTRSLCDVLAKKYRGTPDVLARLDR